MRRSWGWWRRGRGGRLRKEAAVLTSQLPAGTRLASSEGWAAAAAGWARVVLRGPGRFHPIARSVVPYALRLSTATSASSRRRSIPPEKEDEEADGEFGTRINVQGREDETESEIEEWEEEDNADPRIGDGGDGGGINLGNVAWGEHALSLANEVLRCNFSDDLRMFAFKISPKGYIYIRLDKISNRYGCPEMEELEKFSTLYDKRLEESGEKGEIPKDLGLEVSSPGAERLLKVPEDLDRFKGTPMLVHYVEEAGEPKDGVFLLEAVETETRRCVWKLADVRENRDPQSKGRPMNRRRRDWRLEMEVKAVKSFLLIENLCVPPSHRRQRLHHEDEPSYRR